jgi:tryptophanyl-tRNA synthetase
VLTGDRPTGKLHLGHYVGSLANRLKLQELCQQFVMIADMQALTDHAKEPEKVRQSVLDVGLDYLAVGLDPKKTVMFIQSEVPALSELTMYYLNLVSINRLRHNPTVKSEIDQKGFKDNVPAGFVMYPVSQAADITAFQAHWVPVGEDQLPMIEQANELVRAFNRTYDCEVLRECKALIPEGIARLPGTDGSSKMSKSLNNAIYLSDSSDDLAKKVKGMYTDPNHLRVEDPGEVEGNPVFMYLRALAGDKGALAEMEAHYKRGGLGDTVVKKRLLEVLEAFLAPIRARREALAKEPEYVMQMLREGSIQANQAANATLRAVKDAMKLIY